jgi:hypothetical protein
MTYGSPQRPGTPTAGCRRRISNARKDDLLFFSIDLHDTQGFQLAAKSMYISSSSSPARNRSRLLASVKGRPASCPRLQKPHSDKTYREVANLRCGVSRVMREFSNKFLTCRQANLALQEPLLIVLVEDSLLEVGPKFLESIDRHVSGETFRRAEKCVLHVGFAMNAPGIR